MKPNTLEDLVFILMYLQGTVYFLAGDFNLNWSGSVS